MKCKSAFGFLLLAVTCVHLARAKVYTKCGLTEELIRRNFQRTFIGNWVCLIESESGKDTAKVTNKPDGSKNLGLFQINSKEWCKFEKPGGKCNMKCENLLNEDLRDDSECAKAIWEELGFKQWQGWIRSCHRRPLPFPSYCNIPLEDLIGYH